MGKFKDKHGKSRFGKFLQKAGSVVPELIDVAGELATGDVMGAIQEADLQLLDRSPLPDHHQ